MKKIYLLLFPILLFLSGCDTAKSILGSMDTGNLSRQEVAMGLKQALEVGTDSATFRLGKMDGFFKNNMIKILMPPEAVKVEKTLRDVGLGGVVDKAVLSMNRAAEDASKYVGNIFLDAIKSMTIQDAFGILRGGDFAATNFLKEKTSAQLTAAFNPIITKSLETTDATKYWNDVFSVYNRFSSQPVDTDLKAYVTQKALDGLFYNIGLEEQKIRTNPAARITDLLKKVFGENRAGNPGGFGF
ncbi:MAG: DUF4197 domain-containing protein [Ginsengibacter sp.]